MALFWPKFLSSICASSNRFLHTVGIGSYKFTHNFRMYLRIGGDRLRDQRCAYVAIPSTNAPSVRLTPHLFLSNVLQIPMFMKKRPRMTARFVALMVAVAVTAAVIGGIE